MAGLSYTSVWTEFGVEYPNHELLHKSQYGDRNREKIITKGNSFQDTPSTHTHTHTQFNITQRAGPLQWSEIAVLIFKAEDTQLQGNNVTL